MSQSESTLPTWDTETQQVEAPLAADLVKELEAQPPQEPAAPRSETESQPPAEAAAPEAPLASEGEKPPVAEKPAEAESEDVVDEPPEVKAVLEALTIPEARKAAKQWRKDAAPVRDFLNYNQPITNLGTALYELSPSRYTEHVFDLLEKHSKEIFGATFTEVKERLNGTTTTPSAPTTPPVQPATALAATTELTEQEIDALPADQLKARIAQQVEAAAQKAKQETESQLTKRIDDLTAQLDEVKGTVTSHQTSEQQREINTKSQELYDRVWSVVTDGIRELGLEAKTDDPPRIAALKGSARALLNAQAIDDAFTANDQNNEIMKSVKGAMERREFANAFREEDNLKVRVRAALNSLASKAEVKTILDEIAASAQSSAPPPATGPAPPVPGSTAGVTLKPPTTWDEAEQMGAVATA